MPFGIAQIGKSFRNEITPGNFIFRTREFEQMELEFFCRPGTELEWFSYWKEHCANFLRTLGIKEEHMKLRDHDPEELSHYSNATTDIEFLFPFGWGELWGWWRPGRTSTSTGAPEPFRTGYELYGILKRMKSMFRTGQSRQ